MNHRRENVLLTIEIYGKMFYLYESFQDNSLSFDPKQVNK